MTRDDLIQLVEKAGGCMGYGRPQAIADAIIAKCTPTGYHLDSNKVGNLFYNLPIEVKVPHNWGEPCLTASQEVVRRNEQAKFRKWADRLYEIACGMRKEVGDDC